MTRPLSAAFSNAIEQQFVRLAYLAELAVTNGDIYLWTGIGDLDYGGNVYQGNGWLDIPSNISENAELESSDLSFGLTSIPEEVRSLVFRDLTHSSTASLKIVALDEFGAVLGAPYQVFKGFFSTATFSDDADTSTVELTFENTLARLSRTAEHRYNPESQLGMFPDTVDRGFHFIPQLQSWSGFWGRQKRRKRGKKDKRRNVKRKNRR